MERLITAALKFKANSRANMTDLLTCAIKWLVPMATGDFGERVTLVADALLNSSPV